MLFSLAFLARLSIAAVFWSSGQTGVQGVAVNVISGEFMLGWPCLSDSAVDMLRDEYRLPVISPAMVEHVFPFLLPVGLATRVSALALLGMTLVIQFLVSPGADATHGTGVALMLMRMARGPGVFSLDHLIAGRHHAAR